MLGFDFDNAVSLQCFETQFENLGKVGTGGFSIVSKVRNKRDKKIYALKMVKIKPSQLKGQALDYLEKILGQAKILSDLNHPNVIKYHGCWINADKKTAQQMEQQQEQQEQSSQKQEQLQLIMQQYEKSSLGIQFEKRSQSSQNKSRQKDPKRRIKIEYKNNDNMLGTNIWKYKEIRVYLLLEKGEYSLQKYVNLRNQNERKTQEERQEIEIQNYVIILDVIEALLYIHAHKIIHRDIKLQNIVITKQRKSKIIDFGLAKKVRNLKSLTIDKFQHEIVNSDDSERHSSSVGTRIFSSPEQSNSENYDQRTDIYSLGMVIGIMFSEYSTAHEQGQLLLNLRNKKLQNFKIAEPLKILLTKCLSEQKQRPQLTQLKKCIKKLLKQKMQQKQNKKKHSQQHQYGYQEKQQKMGKQQQSREEIYIDIQEN